MRQIAAFFQIGGVYEEAQPGLYDALNNNTATFAGNEKMLEVLGQFKELSDLGYDIRAHVHDEVIITEPIGGRTVEDVCAVMGRTPAWAEGLPLRADGYETPFYRKD